MADESQVALLMTSQDVVVIYDSLLNSINTIWNIYVFVLLGMVGWILARAEGFLLAQKILISIVFTFFNSIIWFYFNDAYADIGRLRAELKGIQAALGVTPVVGGFAEHLIDTDPDKRLTFSGWVVMVIWIFVLAIVWASWIWPERRKRDAGDSTADQGMPLPGD